MPLLKNLLTEVVPMTETVTLPFKDGFITVSRGSRIKVYRFVRGSVKGFLLNYSESGITIFEPNDYVKFGEGYPMNQLSGNELKIPKSNLMGFDFYPEVAAVETKEIIKGEK